MVSRGRDARCSTFFYRCRTAFVIYVFLVFLNAAVKGGHHHGEHGGLDKLLAAGLIAKALAKGGEEGGGGGGGESRHAYMPIPIPLHSGGGGEARHHHHVHHKYVPIPVKHHTNFIIAHHRVPVPVHVPVPVVKTKLVHVPVERTKIVPIIVHKGKHTHPHTHETSYPYSGSPSVLNVKKNRLHTSSSSGVSALAVPQGTRQLRITNLGTVKKIKDNSRNGTSPSIQFIRPSRTPDKWIVVVKNKKRQPIRRETTDIVTSDSKVIPRVAVEASNSTNTTFINLIGPR